VTYCIGMTQGMLNGLAIGSQLGALNLGSTLAIAFDINPDEVYHVFESKTPRDLLQICEPDTAGVSDYVRTIDAYLDAHQDKAGEPLAQVFFEALQDTWPCGK
jgi:Rap1a immunity proteins